MEGRSSSRSCMEPFGDNSTSTNGVGGEGLSPSLMMPLMTTSHHHRPHHAYPQQRQLQHPDSNTLPFSLPIANSHQESYLMENIIINNKDTDSSLRTKIMAHPHFHRLLNAYVNCQKVGAPPEVVARLEEACASSAAVAPAVTRCIGEDPALDQFMEAYCEMLTKYEQELTKPFKEAMLFLQRVECQLKSLTLSSSHSAGVSGEALERNGSSEEDVNANNIFIDAQADDRELKGQLLRRYSGYLGGLKKEFMKKRKKGKLPKEARQQLLDWWSRHYKWPYPSESQKQTLAESTGLDQKQINNWFINQRKRHWKPSEDMQFVVMDPTYPHYNYMDNVLGNSFPMDISPSLL